MENLTLKISSVLNFTLSDTNNEDDVLDHLMKKCCLWINRQSGSQNLGHRHFESISNNFIRLIKNWNWLNSTFVLLDLEIAPKEDDVEIAYYDEAIEGGNTRMG